MLLVSIASVPYTPLPHSDVTRFADYTDDERAQRRMKGKFTDYEQMKAQLPQSVLDGAEAALKSYDDVSGSLSSDDNLPFHFFYIR